MVTANLSALIDGIVRRNPDDLLRFYDRTSARVFGVIGNLVPDAAQRERLMERIYLEVWNSAGDYDRDTFSPGAWLITLAHQMATDSARQTRSSDTMERGEPDPPGQHASPSLEGLPALQRKCVELTYYQGMTVAQASEHLGMTEQATAGALSGAVGAMTTSATDLRSVG